MTGVIVNILLNQGFGFVRGVDNVQRFFHRLNFIPPEAFDHLRAGQGVTFDSVQHPKGLRAVNVRVDGPAPEKMGPLPAQENE